MAGAITPAQARKLQPTKIPQEVFDVFNELLVQRAADWCVTIQQPEVCKELKKRLSPEDYDQMFDKNWLDIEPFYSKKGWDVEYDKPGYNESYEAHWIFTPKGSR